MNYSLYYHVDYRKPITNNVYSFILPPNLHNTHFFALHSPSKGLQEKYGECQDQRGMSPLEVSKEGWKTIGGTCRLCASCDQTELCFLMGNWKRKRIFSFFFSLFAFGSKLLATSELENTVCVTICSVYVKVIPFLNLLYTVASTNASVCFIHSQCPWRNYFVSANFAKQNFWIQERKVPQRGIYAS